MISYNLNGGFEIVDCLFYTRCFALRDDRHQKTHMCSYTKVEFNYTLILAKTFIIPVGPNNLIQKMFLTLLQFASFNSVLTRPFTESSFQCHEFDLAQISEIRGGQPIVDFNAADNCRLNVKTRKSTKLQGDFPSFLIDNFKDHYVLSRKTINLN